MHKLTITPKTPGARQLKAALLAVFWLLTWMIAIATADTASSVEVTAATWKTALAIAVNVLMGLAIVISSLQFFGRFGRAVSDESL